MNGYPPQSLLVGKAGVLDVALKDLREDIRERDAVEHPDAALLDLCARLRDLQQGWQDLWSRTPDNPDTKTQADIDLDHFADTRWPGYELEDPERDDLVGRLKDHRATTLDGMRAKAAAIHAVIDAGGYHVCCRDDEFELQASLIADVAGEARMLLGVQAV